MGGISPFLLTLLLSYDISLDFVSIINILYSLTQDKLAQTLTLLTVIQSNTDI